MESCEMEESIECQKKSWIALRKSINGLLNKINKSNIQHIIPELFGENLIHGRGLFCRSIMKSQLNSPIFTDVFAALVAVVNTKFPQIGELLCRRMVLQLQKSNNKSQTLATVKFIAHLVNQQESSEDAESESEDEDEQQMKVEDETETNLINLRRTIYLTIMSSADFEEAGLKLLKIKLEPGQEMELCIMLLECCSQERTYLHYYALLGQRLCMINKVHQKNFEKSFVQQYSMIHRLETNKLRNVAKFFAHLLCTHALSWHVLAYLRLTEEDTTSSSRIFIKILFQELSEHLGIHMLNECLSNPSMQETFESIFPKDNPKNTRFAINFFTSIGLGGITENLREYLKNMPRLILQQDRRVSRSGETDGGSDDHQRKRRRRS
ncbi:pre-mRNA-splicing factor cwc22 [Datura stramonium]|uniref:Pre-mRNA-splicing factor cwc22 n=1 Tax=Datura stramonium TaxID=4076 RepID=A0ABS8S410_DATST|nr:pre-mRNA-splicing factor cwc22 [Datura stramonium]